MSFVARITGTQDLGNTLRAARHEQHLSQHELAQRCGCSQRLVSELERGKQTAEVGKALSLLTALGLSLVVQSESPAGTGREAVDQTVQAVSRRLERLERKRTSLTDYL